MWVFVEMERGQVHPVSWELMGEGRKLADKLGVELAGVVGGTGGEVQAGTKLRSTAPISPASSKTGACRLSQRILRAR